MTLQLLSKLGDTLDTSVLPRGTFYSQLLIRVSALVGNPNRVYREESELGSVWGINLLPWQMPGTNAAHSTNRNATFLNLGTSKARIQIGTEGASENYLVDYPASGTTVVVAGQQLTVTLEGTTPPAPDPTIVPPVLGCYVSPVAGAPGPSTATLTDEPQAVPGGGTVFVGVPPRARYYRLLYDQSNGATAALNLAQVDGQGNPLGLIDRALATPDFQNPSARRGWYPLHPDCQLLDVVASSLGGTQFSVQWLLTTCG